MFFLIPLVFFAYLTTQLIQASVKGIPVPFMLWAVVLVFMVASLVAFLVSVATWAERLNVTLTERQIHRRNQRETVRNKYNNWADLP